MSNIHSVTFDYDGREQTIETGRYAFQADGAVTITSGETQLLVTAMATRTAREGIDFFPLTVDVEERMYAAGRIPGSFFRREGRATEAAILMCRLIDRVLRPNFPDDMRSEVQIIATVLAVDQQVQQDVLGINGASASLVVSGIPFLSPVGGVRLGLIHGNWVPSPTYQEVDEATFDLVVAGRRNDAGEVDIMMVEAGAPEFTMDMIEKGDPGATEESIAEGLEVAKRYIATAIDAQLELKEKVAPESKEVTLVPLYEPETYEAVERVATAKIRELITIADKSERADAEAAIADEVVELLAEELPEKEAEIRRALRSLQKKLVRERIVNEGIRIDGRSPSEIRPLQADVGVVPRAHGSGLFQRGETQVLTITTLGMLRLVQQLDTLSPDESKRYIHHYNFPPFSTGEVSFMRGPKRREIGHGALAERALLPVVPHEDELPYALRLVSEVLSSNGSTSMASVCGSTLSLMDAGVPIKAPVAGIAMGLIAEGEKFVTLTDILGAEDAFGDMDFKVAGTAEIVTALQLDTKISGLPSTVLAEALTQAKEARLKVLEVMQEAISAPREEMAASAPRIVTIRIPTDKIGDVIGPKGKVINEIQAETGAEINVEDDGTIHVGSTDSAATNRALEWIEQIVNPPTAEIGTTYHGKVVNITKFGAFINILPGRDGLLHISRLGDGRRVSRVEDVLDLGEEIDVLVEGVDEKGKISLVPVSALESSAEHDSDTEFASEEPFDDLDEVYDEEADEIEEAMAEVGPTAEGSGEPMGSDTEERAPRRGKGDRKGSRAGQDSRRSSGKTRRIVVKFEEEFERDAQERWGIPPQEASPSGGGRTGGNRGGRSGGRGRRKGANSGRRRGER